MDTSENYIKMCEMALEIQKDKPDATYATWLASLPIIGYYLDNVFARQEDKIVWLPRQDRLQEMLPGRAFDWLHELWDFSQESNTLDWYSMEQLWLAFVMKTNYGKVWSTETQDWVHHGQRP